MTEEESQAAAVDLANRLRLLMDVAEAESGAEPTYSQIADFLKERGVNLSRSRWTYMINGHRYVQDPAVFEGLAAYFDVDTDFLLGADGATTPEKVTAQLDLVRSMRAAKKVFIWSPVPVCGSSISEVQAWEVLVHAGPAGLPKSSTMSTKPSTCRSVGANAPMSTPRRRAMDERTESGLSFSPSISLVLSTSSVRTRKVA